MSHPLLELESAAFGYDTGFAVKNVTMRIETGEIVLLVGVNGSGKTTIIRGVLGLVRQTAGTVRCWISADRIGYVPQESSIHPDTPATALDVVRIGRSASWIGGREKAMGALRTVGMESMAKTLFSRLSGGQKRRVLLAKALVRNPRLLILDEPTANVDQDTETRIENLLNRLMADSGAGVLAAGHSGSWARRARCVHIQNGQME